MVSPAILPGFLLIVLLISVVPGPDQAFIIAMSIDSGPTAGLRSAAGMAAGMAVWTIATALGLAALLHTVPAALQVIRIAGACYLLVLGVAALRSARSSKDAPAPEHDGRRFAVRGMLTNLANPKIAVFFAAFLPQFVRRADGPATLQLLTLGGLFLLTGLMVDSLVALGAGRLRQALHPQSRVAARLSLTAGIVLCALAMGLVAEAADLIP